MRHEGGTCERVLSRLDTGSKHDHNCERDDHTTSPSHTYACLLYRRNAELYIRCSISMPPIRKTNKYTRIVIPVAMSQLTQTTYIL
jgi:hypothetical protein